MTEPIRMGSIFATFDTEALLERIRAAKMLRVERLEVERARAEVRQQRLDEIRQKLSTLLSKARSLASPTSALLKKAQIDGTAVSATIHPTASLGSFQVEVLQLATATKHTGSVVSAGIDATAPMDQSNFGLTPTYGTFTIGTTGGGSVTLTIDSTDVDAASALDSSNFATAVTAGTFTISTANGGTATITVDPTTQSLNDVLQAINNAGIGVTAQLVAGANGKLNSIRLTSTAGAITLGDSSDTSNFLTATNLINSSGTTERTSTRGIAVMQSLQETIDQINAAGVGITASITNDAAGRPNIITLSSSSGDIQLGRTTDTSNFLTATKLLASPGTTTRQSTDSIARLDPSKPLAEASLLNGPPASGTQSFTINGVTITYDAAVDSLNDIIARINSSDAGVTARYDVLQDRVILEATKTGSMAIALADDGSGNLLEKLGLTTGTQTLGQNAQYTIDGGPVQYSSSNTVTPLTGVTLTLVETTDPGSPVTVTVVQNTEAVVASVKGFVDAFNAALAAIDVATKTSTEADERGELSGDWTVRQLKSTLRSLVTGPGLGLSGSYPNLATIGISFGAVGSAIGTTNTLQFDESKFTDALANDPASVQALLSTWKLQATLDPGGTGSIDSISGEYTGTKPGRYQIVDDGQGNLYATFYPDDGSAPIETQATVSANSTNTTLIPGITIHIGPTLQSGEHTIRVTPVEASPLQQIAQFLEGQAGAGGVLAERAASYGAVAEDIEERQAELEERIDREIERLRMKFIAMDQALARAQQMFDSLTQLANQLAALNDQRRK